MFVVINLYNVNILNSNCLEDITLSWEKISNLKYPISHALVIKCQIEGIYTRTRSTELEMNIEMSMITLPYN